MPLTCAASSSFPHTSLSLDFYCAAHMSQCRLKKLKVVVLTMCSGAVDTQQAILNA